MRKTTLKQFFPALCILSCILSLLSGCGTGEDLHNIPDALTQFYVLDEPDVLDAATEEHIVSVNDSLCAQTGAQVVVVCVQSTGLTSTDEYAKALFDKWQIGDAEKNNGVLILLTIGEQDYWMMPGRGLEDTFSSGLIKLMLNEYLEPDFAIGDYDAGVRRIFDAAVDHLETLYSVTADPTDTPETDAPEEEILYREESDVSIIGWAIIIVIIILLIISFSGGNGSHRRRRHVTVSQPHPRRNVYPYGTRMPRQTPRPPIHRPGSFGGTIGGSRGSLGGSSSLGGSRGGFSGGGRSGGGGFTRGGGAGRR